MIYPLSRNKKDESDPRVELNKLEKKFNALGSRFDELHKIFGSH